jgi:hypothetical protein
LIYSRRLSKTAIATIRISAEIKIILLAFLRLCCVLSIRLNLMFIEQKFECKLRALKIEGRVKLPRIGAAIPVTGKYFPKGGIKF